MTAEQKCCTHCGMTQATCAAEIDAHGSWAGRCCPECSHSEAKSSNPLVAALAAWDRLSAANWRTSEPGMDFGQVLSLRAKALEGILAAARVTVETDERRDAERYRCLRKGNDYERAGPMVVLCETEHTESDERPFWTLAESALDAAVDTVRGAEKTPTGLPERSTESSAESRAGRCIHCGGDVFDRPGKPDEYDHVCLQGPRDGGRS